MGILEAIGHLLTLNELAVLVMFLTFIFFLLLHGSVFRMPMTSGLDRSLLLTHVTCSANQNRLQIGCRFLRLDGQIMDIRHLPIFAGSISTIGPTGSPMGPPKPYDLAAIHAAICKNPHGVGVTDPAER